MGDDRAGLVCDLGRATVRFGLSGGAGQPITPREVRGYTLADFPTFTDALLGYLRATGLDTGEVRSAIAIAGAARGGMMHVTGSRWYVSTTGVAAVLGRPPLAINECAAAALALTTLPAGAFRTLAGPAGWPVRVGGNYLVLSPRQGLGVAALVTHGDRLFPVQTEAGHIGWNPATADEQKVAARLRTPTRCLETLLAEPGLPAIYAGLGGTAPAATSDAVVALAGRDRIATEALAVYAGALGSAIGDLVLAYGAWDGVVLTGALARALAPRLPVAAMAQRMADKDAFRRQLAQVPVALVTDDALELTGAAVALAG
jgi:glucokinase